jgi:hypothetical protein
MGDCFSCLVDNTKNDLLQGGSDTTNTQINVHGAIMSVAYLQNQNLNKNINESVKEIKEN